MTDRLTPEVRAWLHWLRCRECHVIEYGHTTKRCFVYRALFGRIGQ